ncbi:MAG TPA: hypothetical protein VNO34_00480, partial [Actinomycetota bacterium]|nr:hypothetical protein [Actinomycetota bacterium]
SNLLLVCSFHHKLVHELARRVSREPSGEVLWFSPGGARCRPGPAPRGEPGGPRPPAEAAGGVGWEETAGGEERETVPSGAYPESPMP